jgi:hypothetical protein
MRKIEKIYQIKNIRNNEIFTTSTVYEKIIDGEMFVGVWKENDPQRRVMWIRKNSTIKVIK